MSLKILGGMARGKALKVPTGDLIRPMAIRLKRKMFDAYSNWEDLVFLDIFGGSGAIGIEVWSRGAKEVHLCELSSQVFAIQKQNIEIIKESYSEDFAKRLLTHHKGNGLKWLKDNIERFNSETCNLFLAPPYAQHDLYSKAVEIIKEQRFNGMIWLESDDQKGLKESELKKTAGELFNEGRTFRQGTTFLWHTYLNL